MIALHVKRKDGRTFAVACDQNEVTIGRVGGNDIVLGDARVSARHARIVLRDGKLIIVDLKSSNGTYVNGKRISSPLVLRDADKIYIADFMLSLAAPSSVRGAALASGQMPPWMERVDVDATVVHRPSTAAPPPPSPVLPPGSSTGEDEVTPAAGMTPPRPPGKGRTVIDDDVALGLAPVPPTRAPAAPRATLEVRVGGVTVGERVRDDGLLVVHRGKASGRDARIVRLSDGMRDDADARAMLRDATRLTTLFRSPRLPRLLASDEGLLATSPPPGVTTLDRLLTGRGALDEHVALALALEVARALAAVHEVRGEDGEPLLLVHRGVSPKHIEIARDGSVQLEDFLLARFVAPWREAKTTAGVVKGDIAYMAPEQVRGLPLDARCDLWALGVVLYTMANGANPFVGDSAFHTIERVRNAHVPPLDRAPALQPVVDALLAGDRERRVQTAADAIALMERTALSLRPASRLDVERLLR